MLHLGGASPCPSTHLCTAPLCNVAFSLSSFKITSQAWMAVWDSFRLKGGLSRSPFLNTLRQRTVRGRISKSPYVKGGTRTKWSKNHLHVGLLIFPLVIGRNKTHSCFLGLRESRIRIPHSPRLALTGYSRGCLLATTVQRPHHMGAETWETPETKSGLQVRSSGLWLGLVGSNHGVSRQDPNLCRQASKQG